MTPADLIEQVLTRLPIPPTIGETEFEYLVIAQVPAALEELTRKAAAENSGTYLFTKTFDEIQAVNGVADLSDALDDDEPLLPDAFEQWKVYIDGYDYPLRREADRAALRLDPRKIPAYALEDQSLYIKDTAGKLGTYNSFVKLSGAHIPTLENVPRSLTGKLVEIVVRLVLGDPKMKRLASEKQTARPSV